MSDLFEPPVFKLFDKGLLTQLSCSMMSLAKRCAQSAGFKYVLGLKPLKQKKYFVFGRAFDAGTTYGFKLIGSGGAAKHDAVVEFAIFNYDLQVKEGIDFGNVDPRQGIAEAKEKLARSLGSYWRQFGSKIRVSTDVEPQAIIDVKLESGLSVRSIFDVVEEVKGGKGGKLLQVIDVKTASSVWPEGKEHEEFQTDIYPWALSNLLPNRTVIGISYHITVPNKEKANHSVKSVLLRPDRIKRLPVLFQAYGDFYSDLHARGGTAPPCISKFTCGLCDFRKQCEEKYGGMRPTFGEGG